MHTTATGSATAAAATGGSYSIAILNATTAAATVANIIVLVRVTPNAVAITGEGIQFRGSTLAYSNALVEWLSFIFAQAVVIRHGIFMRCKFVSFPATAAAAIAAVAVITTAVACIVADAAPMGLRGRRGRTGYHSACSSSVMSGVL